MNKNELESYLLQGLTTRQISKIVGLNHRTVGYWINKFDLKDKMKYKKPTYDENFFKKINTPEKAYILGFILGDGSISNKDVCINVCLDDREIIDFIQSCIGGNIRIYNTINKETHQYPSASINIGNKVIINSIKTKSGGNLKQDRHIPIISEILEPYLLLGFFDAEGCITWGRRKDRNRIWHKISFTSQFKMLDGIQKILLKNGITTSIKPKGTEKCYVLEFANKKDVLKFLDLIYNDENFVILKRKYNKALALRLELGEFGEPYVNDVDMAIPSEAC